jgi:phage terminase large subunit-like protein
LGNQRSSKPTPLCVPAASCITAPPLAWRIGNVVGKADRRGNLYPTKQRPEQKIDAAVALMMAVGGAMTVEEAPSIYESRGLLIV